MTLTIHTEEDEKRQLQVRVVVAEERVQKEMRQVARQLARGVNIPGFRRGKVPYRVVVQRFGREALRAEAVEELITPVFEETLAEIDVTPYARPMLEDMEQEPMVIEFVIPLEPVVTLGDYRSIRRELEAVVITEEAVEEALEHIRTHHEVLEPVDRPVAIGDMVTLSGTGEVVEEDRVDIIFDEERIELLMDPDVTYPGTEFVENVVGLEVGDQKEFAITFPEEEETSEEAEGEEVVEDDGAEDELAAEEVLAGKEASFIVTILDIKSRYLPELDDELAKKEGDYESLEEMREALREQLKEQAEAEARDSLFEEFMEEVEADSEFLYPPAAVAEELEQMVENLKEQVTRSGWQWDDFLKLQGESEESLREEWEEQARERVVRGLTLREFIAAEYLELSEEELNAAIDEQLGDRFEDKPELKEQMRGFFRSGEGLEMVSGQLMMEKVMERVEAVVSGNGPSLDELAVAAARIEAVDVDEEE